MLTRADRHELLRLYHLAPSVLATQPTARASRHDLMAATVAHFCLDRPDNKVDVYRALRRAVTRTSLQYPA